VAWRLLVRGQPPAAPGDLSCAQVCHWLQGVEDDAVSGEDLVLGASNTADVNAEAVIQDLAVRALERRTVPRTEQTVAECLQPAKLKSSSLANYRISASPSPAGEYPTSWTATYGGYLSPDRPPRLSFGNTVYRPEWRCDRSPDPDGGKPPGVNVSSACGPRSGHDP
jgi:hypothetical protein